MPDHDSYRIVHFGRVGYLAKHQFLSTVIQNVSEINLIIIILIRRIKNNNEPNTVSVSL